MCDNDSISGKIYTSIAAVRGLVSNIYRSIDVWRDIPPPLIDIIASYARDPLLMVFGGANTSSLDRIAVGFPTHGNSCRWHLFAVPTRGHSGDKLRDRLFAVTAAVYHGSSEDAAVVVCGGSIGSQDVAMLPLHHSHSSSTTTTTVTTTMTTDGSAAAAPADEPSSPSSSSSSSLSSPLATASLSRWSSFVSALTSSVPSSSSASASSHTQPQTQHQHQPWLTSVTHPTIVPRLTYGRSGEAVMVTIDNEDVAIMGGDSSSFFHTGSSSERFNGRTWTSGATTHFTRNHNLAAAYVPTHGNKHEVWLCSGMGVKSQARIAAIERLPTVVALKETNNETKSIMLATPVNNGRQCHVLVTIGSSAVLCLGGRDPDTTNYYPTVERCDLRPTSIHYYRDDHKWEVVTNWSLPAAQHYTSGHYLADTIDGAEGTLIMVGTQSIWYTRLRDYGSAQVGEWQSVTGLPFVSEYLTSVLLP